MKLSRRIAATLGAAASVALVTSTAAHAAPAPDPTGKARAHGIHRPGEAFMGWANDRSAAPTTKPSPGVLASVSGMDVSGHQGALNWASWWNSGMRFAYVKATEGNSFRNDYFAQQYNGSYGVGMIRGAYHFGLPSKTVSGAEQADYFIKYGGGWSKDGKTLPGVLDIEYNPYGATCYGLSQSAMVSWIKSFTDRYRSRTGRDAVIYTTTGWWNQCTGSSKAFSSTNPLWIARYASTPGTLPAGWGYYTFWQYTSTPLDKDYFNGDLTRLKALANG